MTRARHPTHREAILTNNTDPAAQSLATFAKGCELPFVTRSVKASTAVLKTSAANTKKHTPQTAVVMAGLGRTIRQNISITMDAQKCIHMFRSCPNAYTIPLSENPNVLNQDTRLSEVRGCWTVLSVRFIGTITWQPHFHQNFILKRKHFVLLFRRLMVVPD